VPWHLTGLHSLDLGFNRLGAEGAAALAPTLQALTGLQSLDLSINSLGKEGAAALARALQALIGLHSLDLSASHTQSAGNTLGTHKMPMRPQPPKHTTNIGHEYRTWALDRASAYG
jgi:Ran GTPase-activating protein (RanGAP) involved in mRNA processing and transport